MIELSSHSQDDSPGPACGGCRSCAAWAPKDLPAGAPEGKGLVLWSLAGFLAPLALAGLGAALLRHSPAAQALGVIAGLAAGALLGRLLAAMSRGRTTPEIPSCPGRSE